VLVVDHEAERFLQPGHQGEHADGVDDARLQQVQVLVRIGAVAREGGDDEVVDDLLRGGHADVWSGNGMGARGTPAAGDAVRIGTDCGGGRNRGRRVQRAPRLNNTTSTVCSRIMKSKTRPWFLT